MADSIRVMIGTEVQDIPLEGFSEQEVLGMLKTELVSSGEISPDAKQTYENGVYDFVEQHGSAG